MVRIGPPQTLWAEKQVENQKAIRSRWKLAALFQVRYVRHRVGLLVRDVSRELPFALGTEVAAQQQRDGDFMLDRIFCPSASIAKITIETAAFHDLVNH